MKNFTLLFTVFLLGGRSITGYAQASLDPSQPHNNHICTGSNVSFTVSATASGVLTYHWQESTDGGISWNDLLEGTTTGANPANGIYTGTTGPTLTITRAPSTMNGNKYRSNVYVNGVNGVSSAQATLNVGPDVSLDNVTTTNCPGTSATLSTASAAGVSYQWQVSSNNGSSWSNVADGADPSGVGYAGGGSGSLTISSLTPAIDGNLYRYIANDGAGCIITSGATTQRVPALAVFSLPGAGTVTANLGQSASIPATVTAGTGPFTYQWQLAAGAGSFTNISTANPAYSGATTSTLTIPSTTTTMYTNRYRVIVKNAGGCATSSTSFAQIGLPVTLPLTITRFSAERQGPSTVRLAWTAEAAPAAASFTVQRAVSGSDFTDVGTVAGEAGMNDHLFVDFGGVGSLRYRVRAAYPDGPTVYSTVVDVAGVGTDEMSLRPSVVTGGSVVLNTLLGNGEPLTVTLTDVTGRILWTSTIRPGKGVGTTTLDVARLGKGIYYVRVGSATGIARTIPFVKE
jgi:hypothetical protein